MSSLKAARMACLVGLVVGLSGVLNNLYVSWAVNERAALFKTSIEESKAVDARTDKSRADLFSSTQHGDLVMTMQRSHRESMWSAWDTMHHNLLAIRNTALKQALYLFVLSGLFGASFWRIREHERIAR